MSEFLKLILSLSLSAGILAVVLFALKPIIRNRVSKSVQYGIWIIVLLRFVLPFTLETSLMNSLLYSGQASTAAGSPTVTRLVDGSEKTGSETAAVSDAGSNAVHAVYDADTGNSSSIRDRLNRYALYLWALGAMIAFSLNVIGYTRFVIQMKRTRQSASEDERRMMDALLNGRRPVRLLRNPYVATPMLIGIIKPCIILPDRKFDDRQLKYILMHELTHLKHFDIAVKWLVMIASSIHWFNPLVYFVKREVNHACELACDESVIRDLGPTERQAYGDTLISVAAEQDFPAGVLQATLSEDKNSLKERLISILKHKRSKPVFIFSIILVILVLLGALYLGAWIGNVDESPPGVIVQTVTGETRSALVGTYEWSYRNRHVIGDSDHPVHFDYGAENVQSVRSGQQLYISAQGIQTKKTYDFTIDRISVYKDGQLMEFEATEQGLSNSIIKTPPEEGEYIYELVLNYRNRGTVHYGFVVRVDMFTYDLNSISRYKTPYVGDHTKVLGIAGSLPVPDKYFNQRFISLQTSAEPYGATIYYEAASESEYLKEWPIVSSGTAIENKSRLNALVAFCMIDNVENITFKFRKTPSGGELDPSQYDSAFTFHRAEFEEKYGNLSELAEDLEKLGSILEEAGREMEGNAVSGDGSPVQEDIQDEFTGDEVESARAVVEEYYRAVAAKEDEAILKTLTPVHHKPNAGLYGKESRALLSIEYDANDPMRESYVQYGRGSRNGTKKENVIVFRADFRVTYPKGATGSFEEGDYTNWSMILIRDGKGSPWLIDDQGY